ncbi:MAG TPA: hypothetical protein VKU89_05320 [Solirubrobacteraceae bacterium]|nr:hypothetical protein [Solirubrobacteraceae bacterium]
MARSGNETERSSGPRELLEGEAERRARLGVPVSAAGVLYLLGAIVIYQSLSGLPTVGIIQGLAPALEGKASVAVSPQTPEIRYISHHALGLIAGSALEAIAIALLTVGLLFLLEAVRLRVPEPSPAVRITVMIGGFLGAFVMILAQIVRAIRTHEFATGHNFTQAAVERAVTTGAANQIVGYLALLLPVVLVVGMIMALLRATRAGLLPRWLRTLGVIAAIILLPLFTGAFTLQIVPGAFMVALGFLLLNRLPGGDPPAWAKGEAIPWPAPERGAATRKAEAAAKAKG